MTASDLAIKNPVFAWMLMAGFMVFGAVGFSRMGISQLPDVDFPVVTVTITYLGAAPEVMESAVADPLEDQLTAIEGLKTLTTVSTIGTMTATLEFCVEPKCRRRGSRYRNRCSRGSKIISSERRSRNDQENKSG